VRAQFQKNLPPRAMGGPVRIMLYPNHRVWLSKLSLNSLIQIIHNHTFYMFYLSSVPESFQEVFF
jgi:hypothetical protein